jgi:hypothetical protein
MVIRSQARISDWRVIIVAESPRAEPMSAYGVVRASTSSSALAQTDGTGRRSSLARIASADWGQTNGLGLALCSAR